MNIIQLNPALSLADQWQRGFPLQSEPFAALATASELTQFEVIEHLELLQEQGALARIGATVRPNTVGASTLAAMAVPPQRLDEVAQIVSKHPAVNHNYEREHDINLWFVVTAANRVEVDASLKALSDLSGLQVFDLPLERSYHIDLGFRLNGHKQKASNLTKPVCDAQVDSTDRALLRALETGLKLVRRPYTELASRAGVPENEVLVRLERLIDSGIITRFGCILRHRRLGYRANAMAVWNVPDGDVDGLAEQLARRDEVTLCYRRTRRPPTWPYNLFAMVHGRDQDVVRRQIGHAASATGLDTFHSAILFSRQCFKQSAARLQPTLRGAA